MRIILWRCSEGSCSAAAASLTAAVAASSSGQLDCTSTTCADSGEKDTGGGRTRARPLLRKQPCLRPGLSASVGSSSPASSCWRLSHVWWCTHSMRGWSMAVHLMCTRSLDAWTLPSAPAGASSWMHPRGSPVMFEMRVRSTSCARTFVGGRGADGSSTDLRFLRGERLLSALSSDSLCAGPIIAAAAAMLPRCASAVLICSSTCAGSGAAGEGRMGMGAVWPTTVGRPEGPEVTIVRTSGAACLPDAITRTADEEDAVGKKALPGGAKLPTGWACANMALCMPGLRARSDVRQRLREFVRACLWSGVERALGPCGEPPPDLRTWW
mmetsp:Transcript_4259/g.12033  ORF Transcript_4259/g.12033 Transcript_4259/m.12033 type:complete len:326 (+) Transcript_4259:795-1772(+)